MFMIIIVSGKMCLPSSKAYSLPPMSSLFRLKYIIFVLVAGLNVVLQVQKEIHLSATNKKVCM